MSIKSNKELSSSEAESLANSEQKEKNFSVKSPNYIFKRFCLLYILFLFFIKLTFALIMFNVFRKKINVQKISDELIKSVNNLFNTQSSFEDHGFYGDPKKESTSVKALYLHQHHSAIDSLFSSNYFKEVIFSYDDMFSKIPGIGGALKSLGYFAVKPNSSSELFEAVLSGAKKNRSFLMYPESFCNSIFNQNIRCSTGGLFAIFDGLFSNEENYNSLKDMRIPIVTSNLGLFFYGKSRALEYPAEIQKIINKKKIITEIQAEFNLDKGCVFLNKKFEEKFKEEIKKTNNEQNHILLNEALNLTGIRFENLDKFNEFVNQDKQEIKTKIETNLKVFVEKKIRLLEIKKKDEISKSYFKRNTRLISMLEQDIRFFTKKIDNDNINKKFLEECLNQFDALSNISKIYNKVRDFKDLSDDEKKYFFHKMIELIYRTSNKLILNEVYEEYRQTQKSTNLRTFEISDINNNFQKTQEDGHDLGFIL